MAQEIRPIRIEGQVAYVPLTRGYEAVIDLIDLPLIEKRNWYAESNRYTVYAARTERSGKKQLTIRMHSEIMGGAEGFRTDHRDGNGLNNRRKNLRKATATQNNRNARIRKDNTSGLKGVSWDENANKWRATITVNRKTKYLGLFDNAEAAHAAYCKASTKFHGAFGRTE